MNQKPAKIAIVSRDFGDVGGSEYFAARLAEGVADDPRYEVHVFTSRPYQGHPAIHVHPLPQPWGPRFLQKPLFAFLAGRALARHSSFDLIHTHEPLPGAHVVTYGTPHEFWVREVRRKKWFGLHDRLIRSLERSMFNHPSCRQILPSSGMVLESLLDHYPHLQKKSLVLEPGLDLTRFEKLDRAWCRKEIRTQQGISDQDPITLFIGNNYHHKGLDQLLQGLAAAPATSLAGRLRLWVIGRGPTKQYAAMAQSLGLQDRVTFLGLIRSDLEKWLMAADFLVLLSAFETYGMVVAEAMAAGLPVLVSDRVGARDLVVPSKTGWMIPHDSSPEMIARALDHVCECLRKTDFSIPTRAAAAACSWSQARRKILEIYEKCLSNNGCDPKS